MVAVTRPSPAADPTAVGARILVVEADDDIAALLDVCLSTSGFEVIRTFAQTSAEVLQAMAHHQPDAVIVDLPLPGSPLEARFAELQRHPDLAHVALLATTTYPPAHRDLVLRRCDAVVAKPFSIGELGVRLTGALAATQRPDPADRRALLCSAAWLDRRNADPAG